jgi:tRNA A-37 threonylcarbamoyl transferase component Bud32
VLDAAVQAASVRESQARREAEAQVSAAVQLPPLNAALRSRVNGATLIDLFNNEDWWGPFRAEFPLVQIVVGDKLLASRGPEIGRAADELILLARNQQIGSALVAIGDQTFVMSAGRLSPNSELAPILLLGRPIAASSAFVSSHRARPHFGDPRFPWPMMMVVGLGGIALIVTRGRSVGGGAMPEPILHRETAKLGFLISPPGWADAPVPGTVTALVRGRAHQAKVSPGPFAPSETQPSPAATPKPGCGRYRLIDRLAEGGMAELFIAEACGVEGFTRNFVLKRLRSDLVSDKQAVDQFIDEARMQATLVHSNIVPVFDFGVADGEYFLTQEYIAGRDLAKLVHRHTQRSGEGLPEALAYYIANETLQALSYAHEKHDPVGAPMGIVHRDISAANVMVSLQGEVKLSDFGIVKSNRRLSKTQAGTVKGNVYFMSPEQARGQIVDHRSDLFSLAHILYHCLTGRLLYVGENDLSVLYRAAKGINCRDLAEIRKLSDPAGQILEKALAFEPTERFQSATEFADALPVESRSGKRATAILMQQLFGDEIRRETTGPVEVV